MATGVILLTATCIGVIGHLSLGQGTGDHPAPLPKLAYRAITSSHPTAGGMGPMIAGRLTSDREQVALRHLFRWLLNQTGMRNAVLVLDPTLPGAAEASKIVGGDSGLQSFVVQQCQESPLAGVNSPRPNTAVIILCSRERTTAILKQIRLNVLESGHLRWLALLQDAPEEDFNERLQQLLREGAQVTLIQRRSLARYDLFNSFMNQQSQVRFRAMGSWRADTTRTDGFVWLPESDKVKVFPDILESYSDMQGRELVVSANNDWPFFAQETLANGTVVGTGGIDFTVVKALAKALNFRFRVVPPPDGQWGGPQPDGSISGLIGMAARWDAHMSIDEITITVSRESVVDFTVPYFFDTTGLVSLAPGIKSQATVILKPFTITVWLSFVAALVFITFAVAIINTVSVHMSRGVPQGSILGPRLYSVWDTGYNMFRCQIAQGLLMENVANPTKFVLIFWGLYCLNIAVYYSGTLTAVLTVPAYEKPIDSLEDGLKATKNGYLLGTIAHTSLELLFSEATFGTYKAVWESFKPAKSLAFTSPKPAIEAILQGNFGMVTSLVGARVLCTRLGMYRFHVGARTFYPQLYGMALPKGAPYHHKFSQMIRRITEAGLVDKWEKDEISGSAGPRENEEQAMTAISMTHLQAAFFLIFLGYTLGLLVLVGEYLVNKKKVQRFSRPPPERASDHVWELSSQGIWA